MNNEMTQLQLNNLRMLQQHGITFDCLQATTEVEASDFVVEELSEVKLFYSWFSYGVMPLARGLLAMFKAPVPTEAPDVERSMQRAMWYVDRYGPYDGLYGFSQGAIMATMLSSPTAWRGMFGREACPWRFTICANAGGTFVLQSVLLPQAARGAASAETAAPVLAASTGALSRAAVADEASGVAIERVGGLPSFHLVGEYDFLHKRASISLTTYYDDPCVYVHAHGHEIPMALKRDAELARALGAFLAKVGAERVGEAAQHTAARGGWG